MPPPETRRTGREHLRDIPALAAVFGQTLRHRPLVAATVCYAAGIGIGTSAYRPAALMALAVSASALGLLTRKRSWLTAANLLMLVGAGALRQWVQLTPGPTDISRLAKGQHVELVGRLVSEPEVRGYAATAELTPIRVAIGDGVIHGVTGIVRARLAVAPGQRPPQYGQTIEARGVLDALREPGNPGSVLWVEGLRRRGIFCTLDCRRPESWHAGDGTDSPIRAFAARVLSVRWSMERLFARFLPRERAAFLTALVLGGHSSLPPEAVEAFRRSGLLHITAASGANVAMVVTLIYLLIRFVHPGPRLRALICLVGSVLYAVAAGSQPAVVRAAIMACVFVAAPLFDRERDAPSALAAAGLAGLACDPGILFDVGFELSFLVVAATIAYWPTVETVLNKRLPVETDMPWLRRALARMGRGTVSVAALSGIAGSASAPLTAQVFNSVPLVGVLSNALAAPAVALLMPAALVGWLIGLVWPSAAGVLCHGVLLPLSSWVMGVADRAGNLPFAAVNLPSPGWMAVFAMYGILGIAAHAARRAVGSGMRP